jgi:hypothetical protein
LIGCPFKAKPTISPSATLQDVEVTSGTLHDSASLHSSEANGVVVVGTVLIASVIVAFVVVMVVVVVVVVVVVLLLLLLVKVIVLVVIAGHLLHKYGHITPMVAE